jgi:hemerythrin
MVLITWTNALSVGIKQLDEQHQHLVALINGLHDAMKAGTGKEVLGTTLKDLAEYTVYHFGTEEQLFKDHAYPDAPAHAAEHKQLTRQVLEVKRKFDLDQPVVTIDLLQFLRSWLNDHIKGVDKRYTSFLRSKGVQ